MKEFHQKQRDEFRLQRKETAWRCCVVFGNTWSSVEDGNKREGAVQREICRAGSQNRKLISTIPFLSDKFGLSIIWARSKGCD